MSRVLHVDDTEIRIREACRRNDIETTAMEPLKSGGMRLVFKSADATAIMKRVFAKQLVSGEVQRTNFRGVPEQSYIRAKQTPSASKRA